MKANSAGFTLTEVLLATALAMIMLFGTLYGSGESFVLIHEGDAKVNTHLQARRVLDRFMKDCRYSTDLIIEGNPEKAWMVNLQPAGEPLPARRVWTWDAKDSQLQIEEQGQREVALAGVNKFELRTGLIDGPMGPEISMVAAEWEIAITSTPSGKPDIALGSATWIRRHAPSF